MRHARILIPLLVLTLLLGSCRSTRCCAPARACPPEPTPPAAALRPTPDPQRTVHPVHEMLATKRVKGLQWDRVPLASAATYLQTVTGIPVELTSTARTMQTQRDLALTMRADDISVRTVLDRMTTELGLAWRAKGQGVEIGHGSDFEKDLRLRYYDLKDFGETALDASGTERGRDWEKALIAEVERGLDGTSWKHGSWSLEVRRRILIARAPAHVHDEIARILDARRSAARSAK